MIDIKEKLDLSSRNAGKVKWNREVFKQYKQYFDNISEFIYYYKNPEKAEKERYCKICGKKNKFNINAYTTYCSRACMYQDEQRREKQRQSNIKTRLERGEEILAKTAVTKFEKYGDKNYNNPNKRAKTNLAKYGTDNLFKDVARMTQARKDKLGVEHALQRADLLKKSQDTLERHYGVRTTFKSKEIVAKKDKTNLERYGSVHPTQNQAIKDKIAKTNLEHWGYISSSLHPEIRKKQQKSLEEHYGVTTPFASQEIRDIAKKTNKERYGEEIYRKSQDFKDKQYKAAKNNIAKITSGEENKIYGLLIEKFGIEDVERQYKTEKYPFACDFYIKSLNLYIEYHGLWTHGKHPFDENNIKDIEEKERIKKLAETSDYYKRHLDVWTDLDVKKMKCFQENKLNFKIFYTMQDFLQWYNN